MSADSTKSNASAAVNAAIADWFEAVKLDIAPNREEFINRYPSIRDALQQFFENADKTHDDLVATESGSPGTFDPIPSDPQRKVLPIPSMVTMISIGEAKSAHNSVVTNTRYRELKHFNKGGLGDLYRAYDELLHRDTAVKMINDRAAAEPTLLTQFRVEAEITSRLDHPGVVPVYGFGEDSDGRPFYVMRLIEGQELSHAIREYHQSRENHPGGAETRRRLLTLLEHLASACKTIAYAHNAGIIHCDIKPANIMVGKYGETIVLDWGLAATFERTKTFLANHATMIRPVSSGDSSSGLRGGTYGYISPEQLTADRPIAPVSDVYSLGATLYEILTGKPPFDGHDRSVTEKIRRGQFPRPRQLLNSIPRRLEAICLKAMSLETSERYSTAQLLAQDLGNWIHDDEILALPDRWYNRVGRRVRRHRGIAATIGLATIVIAVTLAWIFHEEEWQRQSTALA